MNKKQFTRELAEALQTEDKKEQLDTIRQLIAGYQTPIYTLVVRADPRHGSLDVINVSGAKMSTSQVQDLLVDAVRYLQAQERQALKGVPGEEPAPPPAFEEGTDPEDYVVEEVDNPVTDTTN